MSRAPSPHAKLLVLLLNYARAKSERNRKAEIYNNLTSDPFKKKDSAEIDYVNLSKLILPQYCVFYSRLRQSFLLGPARSTAQPRLMTVKLSFSYHIEALSALSSERLHRNEDFR